MKKLKVAIVHDYLKEYGGAERVVETLLEIWPDAPVYTSVFVPGYAGPHEERIKRWNIKTSFLQQIPFKEKLISIFRLIAPLVFRSFDLSDFDVVITSTAGTYTSPNFVKIGSKTTLICYCHTPPRYLYGYPVANDWRDGILRKILFIFGKIPMIFLRKLDFKSAQIPNYIIANSNEVAGRINKFYKRQSTVIYPPVEIPEISNKTMIRDYYLAGGRLARSKRNDLAIKACIKMGLKLKIFGKGFGNIKDELYKLANENIEFVGEIDDATKFKLMKGARGYIFPADQEDFGIAPVEAMAVGTPVIAYKSGGVKETVVEGKTGIFFNELTEESLSEAIKRFEKTKFNSIDCVNQAKKFSKERFKKEIKDFVTKSLQEK